MRLLAPIVAVLVCACATPKPRSDKPPRPRSAAKLRLALAPLQEIVALDVSADGKTLLARTVAGALIWWRLPRGKRVRTKIETSAAALSADGELVAACTSDGAALYRKADSARVRAYAGLNSCKLVALSPSATYLAAANDDELALWSVKSGKRLRYDTQGVNCSRGGICWNAVAFIDDTRLVADHSNSPSLQVIGVEKKHDADWNEVKEKCKSQHHALTLFVARAAKRIFVVDDEGVSAFDTSGKCVGARIALKGVRAAAVNASAKRLVAAHAGGRWSVADVMSGKVSKRPARAGGVDIDAVAVSPDGVLFSAGREPVIRTSKLDGSAAATLAAWPGAAAVVPRAQRHSKAIVGLVFADGDSHLTSIDDTGRSLRWNLATGKLVSSQPKLAAPVPLRVSVVPDKLWKRIVVARSAAARLDKILQSMTSSSAYGAIADCLESECEGNKHEEPYVLAALSVAISSDGRWAAYRPEATKPVTVVDLISGKQRVIDKRATAVVRLDNNGRHLIVANKVKHAVTLHDLRPAKRWSLRCRPGQRERRAATRAKLCSQQRRASGPFLGLTGEVKHATVSADGKRIAASDASQTLVWSVATRQVLQTIADAPSQVGGALTFDHRGRQLAMTKRKRSIDVWRLP